MPSVLIIASSDSPAPTIVGLMHQTTGSDPTVRSVASLREGVQLLGTRQFDVVCVSTDLLVDATVEVSDEFQSVVSRNNIEVMCWGVEELQRLRMELETARVEAETNVQLLRSLAHDIRTPQSATKLLLEELMELNTELTETERRDLLEKALSTVQEASKTVTNFHELLHLRIGALALNLQDTDLSEILERSRDKAVQSSDDSAPTIEIEAVLPGMLVRADMDYLVDAFFTLLRFITKRNASQLTVSAQQVNGMVEINISHNGSAMNKRQLERLQHPLKDLDEDRSPSLAEVEFARVTGLIEAHGGELRLVPPGETTSADDTVAQEMRVTLPTVDR